MNHIAVGTPQYANDNKNCIGCIYHTPRSLGGQGLICNGESMRKFGRCPEWVINEWVKAHTKLDMAELVESMKL